MKMESFLLGDNGPEVFYDVQKTVLDTLDEKYYSPFLSSVEYRDLKNALSNEECKDLTLGTFPENIDEQTINNEPESHVDLTNHSSYARNKLEQLQVYRYFHFIRVFNLLYSAGKT